MCQNNAIKRQGRQPFGAIVVTFLGRGQQWMQHLNWRFEHLHKFHQALIGAAKRTGIAVGIGIVLGKVLQLTDVDLTDQGRNILIVFISRFGFGNRQLIQNRGVAFHHPELADIAIELMQSFTGPGRHNGSQIAFGDAIFLLQQGAILRRIEQTQRVVLYRRALQVINRDLLHQGF